MNKAYVKARESLIPAAMDYANSEVGSDWKERGHKDYFAWAAIWNYTYHTKLNDLAEEIGLVKPQIKRAFVRYDKDKGAKPCLPSEH